MTSDSLSEAYHRLHRTGPEFDGLSNHGPMAVEVLVRRGRADEVQRWVDAYIGRLEELPTGGDLITDATWRDAIGDPRRIGAWTAYLTRQASERPWPDLLATWWPRLLGGVVAGTTHGLIRVGHAVRALRAGPADPDPQAVTELAHGLAYWAARWQPVPGAAPPVGRLDATSALDAVPPIAEQRGNVASRLAQLAALRGWPAATGALRPPTDPADARARLADLVDAATRRYLTHGHGSPVLLVHTATAPNAVLHTLPALPEALWADGLAAAWSVSAALTAAYAPPLGAPRATLPSSLSGPDAAGEILDRALAHGDPHVIKFADTAAEVHARTGDPDALAAAARVITLVDGG